MLNLLCNKYRTLDSHNIPSCPCDNEIVCEEIRAITLPPNATTLLKMMDLGMLKMIKCA